MKPYIFFVKKKKERLDASALAKKAIEISQTSKGFGGVVETDDLEECEVPDEDSQYEDGDS